MAQLPGSRASGYHLDQIILTPYWRAVFWNGREHIMQRVYLLALATSTSQSEPRQIVALTYTPTAGWAVADLDPAFCGLLPPDSDLVPFEADNPCGHTP